MDTRSRRFPSFVSPKRVADLPEELSRLMQEFAKGIEWERYVPPPGVFRSTVDELPEFKEIVKADIQQYLASLDISVEETNRMYQEALQHDLFNYQYLKAAHAFVAEPFPRQNIPLVFYRDYNDEPRYPGRFDDSSATAYEACIAVYKKLYALNMARLKEFADAIQSESSLQQYISDNKKILVPKLVHELQEHSSELPDWIVALVNSEPEALFDRLFFDRSAEQKGAHMAELNNELFSAHLLTQMRFNYDCEAEFAKTTQYDPHCNHHIKALLDNQAPLNGLRYYSDINCFAFTPPWRRPVMIFHDAAELIQDLTSEARLHPPVVTGSSVLSSARGTMFARAGEGADSDVVSINDEKFQLRK